MRAGILILQLGNELCGQPGGRMHRQIDGDELGMGNRSLIEGLPSKVEQDDDVAALPQPSRR